MYILNGGNVIKNDDKKILDNLYMEIITGD